VTFTCDLQIKRAVVLVTTILCSFLIYVIQQIVASSNSIIYIKSLQSIVVIDSCLYVLFYKCMAVA